MKSFGLRLIIKIFFMEFSYQNHALVPYQNIKVFIIYYTENVKKNHIYFSFC
jgi:hypothetical protein